MIYRKEAGLHLRRQLPLKKAGLHTKNVERHGKKAGIKDETNEARLHKKKAELHRTHN